MRDPGTGDRLTAYSAAVDDTLVTEGRALKHVQVREYVRTLVTGAAPGSPAPSERELVHRFGVARMTVRQAMDALVVEGLLERIPGRRSEERRVGKECRSGWAGSRSNTNSVLAWRVGLRIIAY